MARRNVGGVQMEVGKRMAGGTIGSWVGETGAEWEGEKGGKNARGRRGGRAAITLSPCNVICSEEDMQ